jgi:exonuclease SbcC
MRDAARRREAALEASLALDRTTRGRAAELDLAHATAVREEARWSGLDALIGAADGKRFRAHAQSITLERLIGFANAELSHLAPRFSLARAPLAGDLALSVVDREGGHARRSVQSLSGGESFLVSLALALGLAAMTAAEGGRGALTTSSLFLDEGLGALDPASLEIALGALEALRASGRQIAIVTHVPQVAERFAARVEVVPRGAGRGEVRILHG